MMQSFDESEEFNEGIDRKQLAHIKNAFLTLNEQKYTRALTCLSERQQQFLKLLPLLFHVNHAMLPGYVNHHTPMGIYGYSPSDDEVHLAKHIARSFTYSRDLLDKRPAIDALFIMGSLGSIAHSESSDLDVWVCHNSELNNAELAALKEKCNCLTNWAAGTIHIEANFFLMDAKKFSHGQQPVMSSDASGSAQHYLLLDEFYRTAMWLAGKIPLWWFVPADHEINYVEYIRNLLEKRFLPADAVIDFGSVARIPANEFIGAGVWQLYKGIDAPYKSVLKLLLLEVYASQNFYEPLSLELKRKVYSTLPHHPISADELDPYILIYQRLEHYLIEQQQLARLELVRRCFYVKAGKHFSKIGHINNKSWQKFLLEKIVASWNWQQHEIMLIDNHAQWKAPSVVTERDLLVNELQHSHHMLLALQKTLDENAAIDNNELLMLGRKLHAAFEHKAGKIDFINPNISQNITEPALCFVQSIEEGVYIWKAYRGSQQELASHPQFVEPLKRTYHFIEMLLWCYCNNILTDNTKLDVASKYFILQASQLQHLLQAIKMWLPLPVQPLTHESFLENAYPTRIMLLFNIGVQPHSELVKKGMQILSNQQDAFGYSGLKENLVMTAEVVQRNSWGEIICRHFTSDALINCLLYYLRLIPPHKNATLPELTIRCFSLNQAGVIEQRVMHLWRTIIECFYKNNTPNTRFIFEMADEYFLLQFIQHQPHIFRFKTYETLLEKLSAPQTESSAVVIDSLALIDKPIRLMYDTVKNPEVYIFYKIDGQIAYISIIDHKGSLFSKTLPLLNAQTLLRPLYRFVRATIERQLKTHEIKADSPGYFKALQNINIYEIMDDSKHKHVHMELRDIEQDLSKLPFVNIFAIAEPVNNLRLRYTIFCEGKEFSELEYGENLYAEVARYILSYRQSGETYPCYITDLDLSLCHNFVAPHTGIQLIHYLQIKDELEQKLNMELQSL